MVPKLHARYSIWSYSSFCTVLGKLLRSNHHLNVAIWHVEQWYLPHRNNTKPRGEMRAPEQDRQSCSARPTPTTEEQHHFPTQPFPLHNRLPSTTVSPHSRFPSTTVFPHNRFPSTTVSPQSRLPPQPFPPTTVPPPHMRVPLTRPFPRTAQRHFQAALSAGLPPDEARDALFGIGWCLQLCGDAVLHAARAVPDDQVRAGPKEGVCEAAGPKGGVCAAAGPKEGVCAAPGAHPGCGREGIARLRQALTA
eukprot:358547-Chlamydomonas_euryale.AAC.5